MKPINQLIAPALLFAFAACTDNTSPETDITPTNISSGVLNAFLSEQAPENPQQVAALVASQPEVGSIVTLSGQIAGNKKPFGDFAFFTLTDHAIKACGEECGSECPTPWDMCCEDLSGQICTIQFLDDEGQLLRESVRGLGGLTELSDVTVTGTVISSGEGVLVVAAETLFVE